MRGPGVGFWDGMEVPDQRGASLSYSLDGAVQALSTQPRPLGEQVSPRPQARYRICRALLCPRHPVGTRIAGAW